MLNSSRIENQGKSEINMISTATDILLWCCNSRFREGNYLAFYKTCVYPDHCIPNTKGHCIISNESVILLAASK
jgi:hypothetical protein